MTEEQQSTARANISAASAAELEQFRDDVDNMFTGLSSAEATGGLTADDFTWGFVNGSTGAIGVQKNRAVTKDYLPDGLVRVECASPYKMRISAWEKESGAFIGNWNGSGWANTNADHSAFDAFVPEYKYKICLLNLSNDVEYTDFTNAAASVALFFGVTSGTAGDVADALRRKTVSGKSLVITDAIAGAPMRCACESLITISGLNRSPVGEVSISGQYKIIQLAEPLQPGSYVFSAACESTDIDDTNSRVLIGSVWISQPHDGSRCSSKFTLTAEVSKITYYSSTDAAKGTGDTAFWRDIMIVAGSEDKPYEPPVETVFCDANALTLMAQTNILSADTEISITYARRNEWLNAVLSATKSAELNAQTLGYVTPEMFGARGDGVTDDLAAMQAALVSAQELNLPMRATRSYLLSGSIVIGSDVDVQINSVICTATGAAVQITGDSSRVSIRSIKASGVGLELLADGNRCLYNEIDVQKIISGADCILLYNANNGAIASNSIRFKLLQAGGDGFSCIRSIYEEGAGYTTENSYTGGQCANADWAYVGGGGNSKFYNFQVENNIKGGFCFTGGANAFIIGDRHAESQRDGEYPFIKIINTDGPGSGSTQSFTSLRYIAPVAMRVNEIDLSEVAPYEVNDSGNQFFLQSNGSLGVIDCRIGPYIDTGEDNARRAQYFGERALIWGNCLIFQGVPEKYWQVTESMDLRTITENAPAMPTVFEIACENAEIWLHPSYCFMGISRFEVIQTAAHTATIYDYFTGNVIFDGASLGAGEFEVRTYLNGNFARLDGENMIWKVRRISGGSATTEVLTAGDIDGMEVSAFENKLVSEVEA